MERFRLIVPRFPYFNIYSSIVMPPYGALSVATALRDAGGRAVEVIDENNYRGALDHRAVQAERPAGCVGFYGGLTSTIPRLYAVAREYKAMGAVTVAGGVHMKALPDEALDSGIDYVVLGEGERALPRLLDAIGSGADPAAVPGLVFRRDGRTVFTADPQPLTDLDNLPVPDLDLLVNTKRKIRFVPVSRTRGCNFSCEFCSVRNHLGPCRSASPEHALRQFTHHADHGRTSFFVVDDNFVQDHEGTKELCRMLIDYQRRTRKRLDIVVQARAEVARDAEMLRLMKEAGVSTLCIGYESPIDEDLRNMRKGLTVRRLEEYTAVLHRHGFYIHGMFIFGYPTFADSTCRPALSMKERAQRYLEFIRRCKLDTIQVMKPVPLPGTMLRQRLEAEGRIFPRSLVDWDKYDGNWLCFQPDEGCSAGDLQHYATWIMRKVYHPLQIAKFICLIPNYPLDLAVFTCIEAWKGLRRHIRQTRAPGAPRQGLGHHVRWAWGFGWAALSNARQAVAKRLRNARLKSAGSLIYDSWKRNFRKERFYEVLEAATARLQAERRRAAERLSRVRRLPNRAK